jgi:hypothetical protein
MPAIVVAILPDARSEDASRQSHKPKQGKAVHRELLIGRKGAITLRTALAIITKRLRASIVIGKRA